MKKDVIFSDKDIIYVNKRLDLIDLSELHGFFGYPNYSICWPRSPPLCKVKDFNVCYKHCFLFS